MSETIEFDGIVGVYIPWQREADLDGDGDLHVLDHSVHLAQTVSESISQFFHDGSSVGYIVAIVRCVVDNGGCVSG